jgi:DNA invertase Pin-like site-specific DNA recombinase
MPPQAERRPGAVSAQTGSGFTAGKRVRRAGDTLVVPKLDRLARSVPDARAIGDDLGARGIRVSLGGRVYDPIDPMGRMRTREGWAVARTKGRLRGRQPTVYRTLQAKRTAPPLRSPAS